MHILPQHDTFARYSNVAKELRAAAAQIPNIERREPLLRVAREYDERASTAPGAPLRVATAYEEMVWRKSYHIEEQTKAA